MKTCDGRLSAEDVARLEKGVKSVGMCASETFHTYTCAACGRAGFLAKEYEGRWYPESHDPPPRKRVNPSGKSGYYKR